MLVSFVTAWALWPSKSGGGEHQRSPDSVDSEMQRNSELFGPFVFLNELVAALDGIVRIEQIQRNKQRNAGGAHRNASDEQGLSVGGEDQRDGPGERREQNIEQRVVTHGISSPSLVSAEWCQWPRRCRDPADRPGPAPIRSSCGGTEQDTDRSRGSSPTGTTR